MDHKTSAIVRIVIFSIAIVLLLAVLGFGLFTGFFIADTDSHTSQTYTEGISGTADAASVKEIHIEWAAGSIVIQPGDTREITFSETPVSSEKRQMVWKQSGDRLTIQYCASSTVYFGIGINVDTGKDLVITVPRDWVCEDLELDVASAWVEVSDMTIREVSVQAASGTCDFQNCGITDLDMETASGDITFSGTLDTLEFSGASAGFTAVLRNSPSSIEMESASGNLDLTLPEDCGFTAEIEALSGDFTSDFSTTSRNGSHVYGDGSCKISVEGMSGDIIIRKG